jgi:hypothetical protein
MPLWVRNLVRHNVGGKWPNVFGPDWEEAVEKTTQ